MLWSGSFPRSEKFHIDENDYFQFMCYFSAFNFIISMLRMESLFIIWDGHEKSGRIGQYFHDHPNGLFLYKSIIFSYYITHISENRYMIIQIREENAPKWRNFGEITVLKSFLDHFDNCLNIL